MMKQRIIKYVFAMILVAITTGLYAIDNNRPLNPFKDHLIILVHGIGSDSGCFVGQDRKTKEFAFYEYLTKPVAQGGLGIKDNVFAYSFSEDSGDILLNARELGDRSYDNKKFSKDATGKGRSWIEQARYDNKTSIFKQNTQIYSSPDAVPDSIVPSKCIFVVHSMGGLAALAYILSDKLAIAGELPKGFYENDVSKVVFLDSPMRGSEITHFINNNASRFWMTGALDFKDLLNTKWDKAVKSAWDSLIAAVNKAGVAAGIKAFGGTYESAILGQAVSDYLVSSAGKNNQLDWSHIFDSIMYLGSLNSADGIPERFFIANDALKTVFNQSLLSGIVFSKFPNTSDEGIAGKNTVAGLKSADSMARKLKDLKLDRKYDPIDYVLIGSEGSVAYDPDLSTAALIAEVAGLAAKSFNVKELTGSSYFMDYAKHSYQYNTLFSPDFWKLPTNQAKFTALIASNLNGVFTKSGDIVVPIESQMGEGVAELASARRIKTTIKNHRLDSFLSDTFIQEIAGIELVIVGLQAYCGLEANPAKNIIKGALRMLPVWQLVQIANENKDDIVKSMVSHLSIKEAGNFDTIVAAMEGVPEFSIDGIYAKVSGNVQTDGVAYIASSQKVTPQQNAPEIKAIWPNYQIMAGSTTFDAKILVNSDVYQRIPTFDVVENIDVLSRIASSMATGTHRDYENKMPIKTINLKQDSIVVRGTFDELFSRSPDSVLEYSYNFGAWTRLYPMNDYGYVELGPLELAEGQNLLAFRSKNKVGYYSNQVIKFIKSSTPLLPSNMSPEPESVVGGSSTKVAIACDFNDTRFDTTQNVSAIISPLEFKIYKESGIDDQRDLVFSTVANLTQKITQTTYKYTLSLKTPELELAEGKYNVQVLARDIYGHQSQTYWSFFVDRTAPTINIEPVSIYSPNVSTNGDLKIRYKLADNQSTFLKDIQYAIKNKNNETVAILPSANSLSTGEHYVTWNGQVVDGIYTLEIKATDQAGNLKTSSTTIEIDGTAPTVNSATWDHPIMTLSYDSMTLTVEATETANAIIKIESKTTTNINANTSVRMYPISVVYDADLKKYRGKLMINYGDSLNSGLPDGAYNWSGEITDLAGNKRKFE